MADISFADALKAFRRGVHVHKMDWRGVVLCKTKAQLEQTTVEARHIFDASSLRGEYHKATQRFTFLPSGAVLQFALAADSLDVLMLAGRNFTHAIWLFMPGECAGWIKALMRSEVVPPDMLRTDYSGL